MVKAKNSIQVPTRIRDLAIQVHGSAARARNWMTLPKYCFEGKSPLQWLRQTNGERGVEAALLRLQNGDFEWA
jgi:uncharacterized protein (DUF2384 family)